MNLDQRFSVSIHVLTLLAATGESLTSAQIATSVDTHPVVIRRTMADLREHGLVESRPGSHGGWRLLHPPQEITLCDVYRTLNPSTLLALHEHPNPQCLVGGHITATLERVFTTAQSAMEDALCQVTIFQVLEDILAANRDGGNALPAASTRPYTERNYHDHRPSTYPD